MENRKYAEAILPLIAKSPKTVASIAKAIGKTEATIKTYITDCRKRGHNVTQSKISGKSVYRYFSPNIAAKPVPVKKKPVFKDPNHIDNRVKGKTKYIAQCLTDQLGFSVSEQQAVLFSLHLADKKLNPTDFDK